METLTHLKQTLTVAVYKVQFEALLNRLRGLPNHHKLIYFLSCLKGEIWLPVWIPSPLNLNAALGLARIQEEYITSSKKSIKLIVEISNFSKVVGGFSFWSNMGEGSSRPEKFIPQPQRILSMVMDKKLCKALFYHYEEKWSPTQVCKSLHFYILQGQNEGEEEIEEKGVETKVPPALDAIQL